MEGVVGDPRGEFARGRQRGLAVRVDVVDQADALGAWRPYPGP
jgi:hypothetical protein